MYNTIPKLKIEKIFREFLSFSVSFSFSFSLNNLIVTMEEDCTTTTTTTFTDSFVDHLIEWREVFDKKGSSFFFSVLFFPSSLSSLFFYPHKINKT